MAMPPIEDDDTPTLKEVCRVLRDFRDEFRRWSDMVVRKDVHAVEHEALNIRVARLEAERDAAIKESASRRNQFYFALLGTGLSIITSIVLAWNR